MTYVVGNRCDQEQYQHHDRSPDQPTKEPLQHANLSKARFSRDRSDGDHLKAPKQNSNDDQLYQYRQRIASAVCRIAEVPDGHDGHDGYDRHATSIDRADRGGRAGSGFGGDAVGQVERAGNRSGSSDSGADANPRSNSESIAYRAVLLVQLLFAGSAGRMDGAGLRVELRFGRASREGPVSGVSGLQTGLAVYPAS